MQKKLDSWINEVIMFIAIATILSFFLHMFFYATGGGEDSLRSAKYSLFVAFIAFVMDFVRVAPSEDVPRD